VNEDYLWDRSGEPDVEIENLERVLGTLRMNRPAPELPVHSARNWKLAIAAGVAVAAISSWLMWRQIPPTSPWQVAKVEGRPEVAGRQIQTSGNLRRNQWLITDASSRAQLVLNDVGQVDVDPNSRVRLVESHTGDHRLQLAKGKLHAFIWAGPGQFAVDTPSARAVDLGCAYTLEVDDKGIGLVHVTTGWVGFQHDGRESFIPAGAECLTKPGAGPQTPYYADASPAFRGCVRRLDAGDASALSPLLAEARQKDAFTLWHLLFTTQGSDRERVYAQLAKLVPPPAQDITREGILKGDRKMLDLWWNQLGLEDTNWWRQWERKY
jgi:hypothetical protein